MTELSIIIVMGLGALMLAGVALGRELRAKIKQRTFQRGEPQQLDVPEM